MKTYLPPLRLEVLEDREYWVDDLFPVLIVALSGIQAGCPTLKGTRLPTYATWIWHELGNAETEIIPYTREQIIAVSAFEAGV